ncbi:ABC transporter ATP-binding protein [Ruminiclostridium josui]|uniref:ABC transporter ATP-binding protein n=1 Tax=Ruminiclostridium josui TaxID=1499 RepID=UPI0004AC5F64|nr:ABC transporter ATP-binding protein [Ruminiclostridium josui]
MITVDSLSIKYKDFCAVDNISFSVNKCEIFGIIGANGVGKTSTVECIEGLRKPTSGRISVMGLDPWKDRKKLQEIMGVQLQDTSYQDRAKVYEICELFSSFYNNPMPYNELLNTMGLEEKRKSYISKLSGGQKQKLAIVLSLISNPKLVFLDELTTGLDPKARRQMWDLILKLRENGLTIVIVSHFMDEVETLCDRIAIMSKGHIQNIGTVDSIISKYNLKQKISFKAANLDIESMKKLGFEVTVQKENDVITMLGKADDYVSRVLAYLTENNIAYKDLTVKSPDLEDVFLDMVGYVPEDEVTHDKN